MKLSQIRYLVVILMLFFNISCSSESKKDEESIIGSWLATEMEGKVFDSSSDRQYSWKFNPDHSYTLFEKENGAEREKGKGAWQFIKKGENKKILLSHGYYPLKIVEFINDKLTFIDERDPNKNQTIWKRQNSENKVNEEISETNIKGSWSVIEMEGKVVDSNSERQYIWTFNPDHSYFLQISNHQKKEGAWIFLKSGDDKKLILSEMFLPVIIELKNDQMTFMDEKQTSKVVGILKRRK